MGGEVVRTSGLTRTFDARTAVDNLSLAAHAGEILRDKILRPEAPPKLP